jgi:3-hydroxyacyl-CoA dehydrogenase
MGFLGSGDRIVMNRDHLLAEAKRMVLALVEADYRPPARVKSVYAAGRDMLATLLGAVYQMEAGGYASAYDAKIARKLAYVLCGGDLSEGQWVDEQYILDLEREAFLSLCGEPKTIERMWHILQTGKPLRN